MNAVQNIIGKFMPLKRRLNPSRRIALVFLLAILIGALLLMLPVSARDRTSTPFITALFTSTSAVCVTGLTLVETGTYFSLFGQAVIMCLIEIGGLGFMTVLIIAFVAANKHIGISQRLMLAESLGLERIEGVVRLTKIIFKASLLFELAGAIALSLRFIPRFGILNGIWFSIFHSVSAFCNAGFDIFGNGNSIASFSGDYLVLITLACLIIIGGIGFVVWEETARKRKFKKLSVYSRLVIIMTLGLIVFGTIGFFVLEMNNPETIADKSMGQKILASFFQAVTTRTAGFDAVNQTALGQNSKLLTIILMMIGGASGSTAGGIKVVTMAVALVSLRAVWFNKTDVIVMGRKVKKSTCVYALALVSMWLILVIAGGSVISTLDHVPLIDALYEAASAYGTVGLSEGVTAVSSMPSKALLILYMFMGRVGILTVSVSFTMTAKKKARIDYPDVNLLIG